MAKGLISCAALFLAVCTVCSCTPPVGGSESTQPPPSDHHEPNSTESTIFAQVVQEVAGGLAVDDPGAEPFKAVEGEPFVPRGLLDASIMYRGSLPFDIEGITVREFSRRASANSFNECGWLVYEDQENVFGLDCHYEHRDISSVFTYYPSRNMARLDLYDTASSLEFTADNANLFINQFGALASLAGKRHFDSVTLDVFLSEAEQEAQEAEKKREQEARRQAELEAAEEQKRYEEAEQTLRDTHERLREALKRCDLTEYEQGWSYQEYAGGDCMNCSLETLIEKAQEFESIIEKAALCKGPEGRE